MVVYCKSRQELQVHWLLEGIWRRVRGEKTFRAVQKMHGCLLPLLGERQIYFTACRGSVK